MDGVAQLKRHVTHILYSNLFMHVVKNFLCILGGPGGRDRPPRYFFGGPLTLLNGDKTCVTFQYLKHLHNTGKLRCERPNHQRADTS